MPTNPQEPDRPYDTPLAQRLRADRKAARFTQKIVSEALGIEGTQLSSWENGLHKPVAARLLDLADLYETEVADYIHLATISPSSGKAAERSKRYREKFERKNAHARAEEDQAEAPNVRAAGEKLKQQPEEPPRKGSRRRRRQGPPT